MNTEQDAGAPDQAELLFRAGEYDKALPLYQQQLATASEAEKAGHILFLIGQCLTGMGKYPEAIAAFQKVVVKFPTSSFADKAVLRKGSVQAGLMKLPKEGISTWQELINKYPRSDLVPEARFLVGMVYWIEGQKTQAKGAWQFLTFEFPNHPRSAQARLYLGEKAK